MDLLEDGQTRDPFPPSRHFDDAADRRDANRALGVSGIGLALTGFAELAIALLSGSVGLLGDALHNLSDVSTSLVVFVGFGCRSGLPAHRIRMATSGPKTSPASE